MEDAARTYVGEGVAGEADDGFWQSGGGVEGADLGGGEFIGRRSQVDSVCAGGEGDVCSGVDEEPGPGRIG